MGLELPKHLVVNTRIDSQVGQIPTHQCKQVFVVQATYLANAVDSSFIANVAAQCIGGIGWIRHNTALPNNFAGMPDQPFLRCFRVNDKKLTQSCYLSRYKGIDILARDYSDLKGRSLLDSDKCLATIASFPESTTLTANATTSGVY
jgi:hypothetical protein